MALHCASYYNDTFVWRRNIPLRRHMRAILYQIIERQIFYRIIIIPLIFTRAGTIPKNIRYPILSDIRYLELMRYRCQTIFDIFTQSDIGTKRYPITSKSARWRYKNDTFPSPILSCQLFNISLNLIVKKLIFM